MSSNNFEVGKTIRVYPKPYPFVVLRIPCTLHDASFMCIMYNGEVPILIGAQNMGEMGQPGAILLVYQVLRPNLPLFWYSNSLFKGNPIIF